MVACLYFQLILFNLFIFCPSLLRAISSLFFSSYHARPVSTWLRYVGLSQTGRVRSFPFTLIAKDDSNHLQPFSIIMTGTKLAFGCNAAGDSRQFSFPTATYDFNYWSKMTMTYSTDGMKSHMNMYINGTLHKSWSGFGKPLRFHESSTLVIGMYCRVLDLAFLMMQTL